MASKAWLMGYVPKRRQTRPSPGWHFIESADSTLDIERQFFGRMVAAQRMYTRYIVLSESNASNFVLQEFTIGEAAVVQEIDWIQGKEKVVESTLVQQ